MVGLARATAGGRECASRARAGRAPYLRELGEEGVDRADVGGVTHGGAMHARGQQIRHDAEPRVYVQFLIGSRKDSTIRR